MEHPDRPDLNHFRNVTALNAVVGITVLISSLLCGWVLVAAMGGFSLGFSFCSFLVYRALREGRAI